MHMLLEQIMGAQALFDPGAHTELRAQISTNRRVGLIGGEVTTNVRAESCGVSARVLRAGVYGFCSMAEMDEEAAKTVLAAASENARFLDSHVNLGKGPLPPLPRATVTHFAAPRDAEQREYVEFARAVDAYLAKKYPALAARRVVAMSDSMEKALLCSDGACGHNRAPRSYVYVMLTDTAKDGTPVDLFEPFGGAGDFPDRFSDPAALFAKIDALYERLQKKKEGVRAQAGVHTCVLSGELTGMLAHEAVGHTVEADLVLGGSVAASCLNKQVASPLVNLSDFAYEAFGKEAPLPVYLDDEGTVARDVRLIENGVLTGYMNSRESAQHFGMEPCGNARAFAFSDEPLIRMRNTAVHPGHDTLADMIASVEDGYYLVSSNNGQADTTGEFMFGVTEGYEIKHGKLGRALLDTTLSGIAFEMLKTVDMLGDTMHWVSAGMCGKKQPMPVSMGGPDLRCRVMIGGE